MGTKWSPERMARFKAKKAAKNAGKVAAPSKKANKSTKRGPYKKRAQVNRGTGYNVATELEAAKSSLANARGAVQNAVLMTPTGLAREKLSNAFIHIMAATDELDAAETLK